MTGSPAINPALLAEADRRYLDRDWGTALVLYRQAREHSADRGAALALPIGIAHCEIELAPPDRLPLLPLDRTPCPSSDRSRIFVVKARYRALELCAAGEFARAACLLRFLGTHDGPIAHAYVHDIDGPRTRCADSVHGPIDDVEPRFLAETGMTDDVVAAAKARHRGRRILLVGEIYPTRQYEVLDNLERSAGRFGLVARRFDTNAPGLAPDDLASALLAAILAFKPDIVVCADLFEIDVGAFSPAHAEQIAQILALARQTLGLRVVRYLTDAWRTAERVGGDLYAGLGDCVDLVLHQYPCVLDRGSARQRAAVFCFPCPCEVPVSTVEPGVVPRASFAGRMHEWAYPRAVWWAECGRAGLPVDFSAQFPWEGAQRLDPPVPHQAYADRLRRYALSLSLTKRLNGMRIMTMRSLETLLCGGVLLEETAPDTAYFLKPGRHLVVFQTMADLAEALPALIADRARRLELAEAGRQWVSTYFTGDYFWAGLLDKLAALG